MLMPQWQRVGRCTTIDDNQHDDAIDYEDSRQVAG
jgi:hypothetical protein